jgi:hypothetical protein
MLLKLFANYRGHEKQLTICPPALWRAARQEQSLQALVLKKKASSGKVVTTVRQVGMGKTAQLILWELWAML